MTPLNNRQPECTGSGSGSGDKSGQKIGKRRRGVLRTEEDKFGVVTRRASVTIELKGGPRGDMNSALSTDSAGDKCHHTHVKKKHSSAMDKVRLPYNEPHLSLPITHGALLVICSSNDHFTCSLFCHSWHMLAVYANEEEIVKQSARLLDYDCTAEHYDRRSEARRRRQHEDIRRLQRYLFLGQS